MLKSIRLFLALTLAIVIPMTLSSPAPVSAALFHHHARHTTTHRSFVQRHKLLTSAAAGVAAYKIAKHTGNARAMHGRKRNIAQRHPFISGMVAAAATHHALKKSEHYHHRR